jgi:hypothetical protein
MIWVLTIFLNLYQSLSHHLHITIRYIYNKMTDSDLYEIHGSRTEEMNRSESVCMFFQILIIFYFRTK